ncbi:MAG: helix-turn-helix domain-containing protein, partial [Dehalococcoidia bacterium]
PPDPSWITLGDASRLLGVSESTIRRWADANQLRSYRTPGGHRRIHEGDLREMLAGATPPASSNTDRITDVALARVRRRLSRGGQSSARHQFEGLDPETIDRLRLMGRQQVELFARVISGGRSDRANQDAHMIGREYGRILVGAHVGLTTAIATFNALRRTLEETASQIATEAGLSTEDAVEAIEHVLDLSDVVLEGMASVFDSAQGSPASP